VPEGDGRWIEYAGGYTDMLAQRGADLTRETRNVTTKVTSKTAPETEAKPDAKPAPAGRRRLGFKEKHLLETLPGVIAKLAEESAVLQARLDDPGFYPRDRDGFEKTTAAPGAAQTKLAQAEEQW